MGEDFDVLLLLGELETASVGTVPIDYVVEIGCELPQFVVLDNPVDDVGCVVARGRQKRNLMVPEEGSESFE